MELRIASRFKLDLFIQQRAIDLGGIEERDAPLHGGVQESDHLPFILWRPVGPAHSHAAKSDGGYFQIPNSKFAFALRLLSESLLAFPKIRNVSPVALSRYCRLFA